MGMGFGANFADVVEWKSVKKLCPKEARALERLLKKHNITMANFARAFQFDEADYDELGVEISDNQMPETTSWDGAIVAEDKLITEIGDKFKSAYAALVESFGRATTVTLRRDDGPSWLLLAVGCHNAEDEGDRYDEVDGAYWYITNAYKLTPAGEAFKDKFERKFFVSFC